MWIVSIAGPPGRVATTVPFAGVIGWLIGKPAVMSIVSVGMPS